ncbi:glucose/galactose MFS transporter, partial [Burkholderia pseudomallei]|nr:glucose/galactose MFS transporter [Burkholderia pseudomallei]
LVALYVIAIGLAFLETASNPYVTILGARETASARLNLAQSFYGVGAILGPIVGGLFIFSTDERTQAQIAAMAPAERAAWRSAAAAAVQGPYVAIGVVVCLIALLIACTRFPALDRAKAARGSSRSMFAVLRHRGLLAAIIALFLY